MVCAPWALRLQFILQWSTGILVLICCFVERKHFAMDISSKLGSSFSLVPFVIVVVSIFFSLCILCGYHTAMIVIYLYIYIYSLTYEFNFFSFCLMKS